MNNEDLQNKKLVSVKDLCDILGVSKNTVHNYIKSGMPVYYVGGFTPRFDVDEVLKWGKEKALTRTEKQV